MIVPFVRVVYPLKNPSNAGYLDNGPFCQVFIKYAINVTLLKCQNVIGTYNKCLHK